MRAELNRLQAEGTDRGSAEESARLRVRRQILPAGRKYLTGHSEHWRMPKM